MRRPLNSTASAQTGAEDAEDWQARGHQDQVGADEHPRA
jgi:hypothetical protein